MTSSPPHLARGVRRVAREPLVHFLLLGAALFGADRAFNPRDATAARDAAARDAATTTTTATATRPEAHLVLTPEAKQALVEEFTRAYGHAPSAAETTDIVRRWVDEEILYREGLARHFEREDPRIRQRVAQKMSFVIGSAVVVPEPTEDELASWFREHPGQWATPSLMDFTQVFVEGSNTAANERARAILAQLRSGAEPAGLGDTFPGGRRYRRRKVEDLAESFGPDFAKGLAEQKEDVWELRLSRFGHHLVHVDRRTPAEAPALAAVREEVKLDWEKNKRAALEAAALAELRQRWSVETPP